MAVVLDRISESGEILNDPSEVMVFLHNELVKKLEEENLREDTSLSSGEKRYFARYFTEMSKDAIEGIVGTLRSIILKSMKEAGVDMSNTRFSLYDFQFFKEHENKYWVSGTVCYSDKSTNDDEIEEMIRDFSEKSGIFEGLKVISTLSTHLSEVLSFVTKDMNPQMESLFRKFVSDQISGYILKEGNENNEMRSE